MLNNLTNFFNLFTSNRFKRELEDTDVIAVGTQTGPRVGSYKPTAIQFKDLKEQLKGSSPSPELDINYIFVSSDGDDSNLGTLSKPVKSLHVAKSLANFGDTVYVLPGEYVIDNTIANGSPFTGNIAQLNLWKNGVTYYFAEGAKLKVYNENPGGQRIVLFQPGDLSQNFETCSVTGYLDLEVLTFGSSNTSVNGVLLLLGFENAGDSYGFRFDLNVANIYSNTPLIEVNRAGRINPVTLIEAEAFVNINIKNFVQEYLGFGAINFGSVFTLRGGNNNININIDYLQTKIFTGSLNNIAGIIDLRAGVNSKINVNINKAIMPDSFGIWGASSGNQCRNVNVIFGQLYFGRGIIYSLQGTHVINISGSFYDIDFNNVHSGWAIITQTNVGVPVFNIKGDIQVNSDKRLISNRGGSIILESNVLYLTLLVEITDLSGQVPNPVFRNIQPVVDTESAGGLGRVTISGSIRGQKDGKILRARTGEVTFKDLNLFIAVPTHINLQSDSLTNANANVFITNSSININTELTLSDEQYTNYVINNSTIKVNNSLPIFKNNITTAFAGKLSLLHSTLINNDNTVDTIEYSDAVVVSANSAVKGTYNIVNFEGSLLDQLPNL